MISLLISLVILLVVVYIIQMIIEAMGLPDNIKKIAYLILGLFVLIALLSQLGFIGNGFVLR